MALASSAALAAAGSWSATVDGPRVAGAGRDYVSAPLTAPAMAADAKIRSIRWRVALPPGRTVAAELCTDRRCAPVKDVRGASDALAGEPADAPLQFRFRLPPGQRTPVQVGAIQLLVDYR
jgi:flagellar protein FlhE